PGGPGWQKKIHGLIEQGIIHFEVKSPQECCEFCRKIPECAQWAFVSAPGSVKGCRTWAQDGMLDACNFTKANTIVVDGGIVNCND
ncbi:17800_t:CDS:1, partial [Racocetra fulgida]